MKKKGALFNVKMTIKPNMEGPEVRIKRTIDFKEAGEKGLQAGLIAVVVNIISQAFNQK